MLISKIIYDQIDCWVAKYIRSDFTFRKYQKEIIARIVFNIVNNINHNNVIEAPTGSGKSYILIISAGVLSEYYQISSYILCSDLQLWEQYERSIKPLQNNEFAAIKGQISNYTCKVNHEDIQNADCKMCGLSWQKLYNNKLAKSLGYSCARTCEYVQARKKCINASVILTTYQTFLYQLNSVKDDHDHGGNTTFSPRPVIFCDECHNIPDIIQTKMTPIVEISDFDKLKQLYTFAYNESIATDLFSQNNSDVCYQIVNSYPSWSKLEDKLVSIFKDKFNNFSLSKYENYEAITEYVEIILMFKEITDSIQVKISELKQNAFGISSEYVKLYKTATFLCNYMCYWGDFLNAINSSGYEYLLKYPESSANGDVMVKFSCVKEDWMIYKYLLSKAEDRVMVSATICGKESYEENIGAKYTDSKEITYTKIPSTFNFNKSPIYLYTKYRATVNTPENIPCIFYLAYDIINSSLYKRGIIQSGNYELARKFCKEAPKEIQERLISYSGNKEKIEAIEKFKKSTDGILIGPTLNEGVDLPDNYCRFNIILKVPYPNLTNKLVKTKKELFPKWYINKTITSVVQGIGRGVRNENDWCATYILDGCFCGLYKQSEASFPDNFKSRICYINI